MEIQRVPETSANSNAKWYGEALINARHKTRMGVWINAQNERLHEWIKFVKKWISSK